MNRSNPSAARPIGALVAVIASVFCGTAWPAEVAPKMVELRTPIHLDRCAVESRSVLLDPFNGLRSELVSGIAVRFFNAGVSSATIIRLRLAYSGSSLTIIERGSFRPGVAIERTYNAFAGTTLGARNADCQVASAEYADGTVWISSPP